MHSHKQKKEQEFEKIKEQHSDSSSIRNLDDNRNKKASSSVILEAPPLERQVSVEDPTKM